MQRQERLQLNSSIGKMEKPLVRIRYHSLGILQYSISLENHLVKLTIKIERIIRIKRIHEILGHRSSKTTEIYTHVSATKHTKNKKSF